MNVHVALLATASTLLVACATTPEEEVDFDLANTDGGGKADAIGTRHVTAKLADVFSVSNDGADPLDRFGEQIQVITMTRDTMVVRAQSVVIVGTDEDRPLATGDRDWYGDRVLQLTVGARQNTAAAIKLGFSLFVPSHDGHHLVPVACAKTTDTGAHVTMTYFREVNVDLQSAALYIDNETWSFAQCGLATAMVTETEGDDKGRRDLVLMALPLALDNPAGSLVGTYFASIMHHTR